MATKLHKVLRFLRILEKIFAFLYIETQMFSMKLVMHMRWASRTKGWY